MKRHMLARVLVVATMLTLLIAPLGASAASYGLVSFWGDVRLVFSDAFESGLMGCAVELYAGDTLVASCSVQNVTGAFSFHKNLAPGLYTVKVVGVDDAYVFQSAWVNGANAGVAAPELTFDVTSAQIPGRFGPILFKYTGGVDPECNPSVAYVYGRAVDENGDGLNNAEWRLLGRNTVEGQAPGDGWNVVAGGRTGGHMPDGSPGGWFGASIRPAQFDEWLILAREPVFLPAETDGFMLFYLRPVPRYENDPWVVRLPVLWLGERYCPAWLFKSSDFDGCMPTIIGAHPTVGFLLKRQTPQ